MSVPYESRAKDGLQQLGLDVAHQQLDGAAQRAADTNLQTLLLVAFSRWRVERCLQDQKWKLAWINGRAGTISA